MSRAGKRDQLGKGGIFEELDPASGQFEIKAFDSDGARLAMLQFRADTIDDELIVDLKRWHERQCPRTLTIVRSDTGGSAGAASGKPPRRQSRKRFPRLEV
jgi:hypothetical protein